MKFLFLGKYSNAGLAGFLKNPEDDRRAAISKMDFHKWINAVFG